jgi:hypothetical protein
MKPAPSFLTIPAFCTSGTRTQPSAGRLTTGYQYLNKPPVEEHNYLFGATIDNLNTGTSGVSDLYTEFDGALTTFGITPNASVTNQITQMIYKSNRELGHYVGEIFPMQDYVSPVAWAADGSTMTTYMPAVCLTTINDFLDITATNYPNLVPYLRGKPLVFKQGLSGTKSTWTITNWSTSGTLATVTLANNIADGDEVWLLNSLTEDYVAGGGTTGACITLTGPVGNIAAGDYTITGGSINSGARTFTFSTTATAGSGSGTFAVLQVYPHRVAGSNGASITTSARLFNARGYAIHGTNDLNSYMVAQLRRRGAFQGHWHDVRSTTGNVQINQAPGSNNGGASGGTDAFVAKAAITDGTSGSPITSKITNTPLLGAHLYIHAGTYLP